MRELFLYRHAETHVISAENGRMPGPQSNVPTAMIGMRDIKQFKLYPLKIGVSSLKRTQTTAKNFVSRVVQKPKAAELVVCDFLDELDDSTNTFGSRYELIQKLAQGIAPPLYEPIGESILNNLAETDPEINLFFTHGSVLASILTAQRGTTKTEHPSSKSLVVPPLGHISLKIN